MDRDLCNHLPYEARADFRLVLLTRLLWDSPDGWRLRRTDRIEDRDGESFNHSASIDFRLKRRDLIEDLSYLRILYERAPSLLELADASDTCDAIVGLMADESAMSTSPAYWSHIDAVVPIGWLLGPASQLEVAIDGAHVAPLNRFDTAELVARSLTYLMVRFADERDGLLSAVGDLSVLRRYFWLVTVCDTFALDEVRGLRSLRSGNTEKIIKDVLNWMEAILSLQGYGEPDRSRIERRLRGVIEKVEQVSRRHLGDNRGDSYRTPLFNPLLLFPAYIARVSRDTDPSSIPVPATMLDSFLGEVMEYTDLADRLVGLADDAGSPFFEAGNLLVSAVNRLSWLWPLVVRSEFDVDGAHTASYSSVDTSTDGGRGSWREYDLFLGDAASYHVELTSPHGELEFVRHSAKVVALENDATVRLDPAIVFDRINAASRRLQAFYTTASWAPATPRVGNPGARLVRLRIKQRVSRSVMWTNWLVVSGVLLGTLYLWFLAICDGLLVPHGDFTVVGVFKFLAPIYLAVLLLFTIERHGSSIVAKRLRWPWRVAVVGLLVGVGALLYRTACCDSGALPWSTVTLGALAKAWLTG